MQLDRRESLPRVVIIGGGFGGLTAARELGDAPVSVTLVDRRNHHLFQPLLYQVATGGLTGPDIAAPIRGVLQEQANATVLLGEVQQIDLQDKTVTLRDGDCLPYDHLIVAAGANTNYFGHDEWADDAPGLKTVQDALEVRRRLYLAYEAAEREPDPHKQRRWLTFVIVGGGPTGVELAGAIAEIARNTLARDFRNFDPSQTRVVLVEGMRLLPGLPDTLADQARAQLEARGVEVRVGTMVSEVDDSGVSIGKERIHAETVIWTAGVEPSPLGQNLGVPTHEGKVCVEPDLSVPGHPEVYVVGDMMALEQDGQWLPGVAQVAIQGGRHAARNVHRQVMGEQRQPFRYRDKGMLATIGRSAAVARVGRLELDGFLAWLLWWAVHIFFLIGFRNRVAVMMEWAYAYLTWRRSARIIVPEAIRGVEQAERSQPALPEADRKTGAA